ncbi:sulfatase [Candidatus Calescamantes bacterium]|nr:sulfatase [Candidatus Calescamantes bacterium]
MNFIIIISDTLRRDHLGCYGNNWISTPHIDRFAEKSLVFDKAYSASFPTVPHRRDVLTGRFTASYTGWAPLSEDEVVLPEVLGKKDYISMMVCDTPHILENGYHYDKGFDGFEWIRGQESDRWKTYPENPEHPCNPKKIRNAERLQKRHRRNVAWWRKESDRFVARTMSYACEWLEENYKRENFFLYVDTFDPHEPWDPPQWYVDMYNPDYKGEVIDYPLYSYTDFLTPQELKHCRALYAGEVTLVDRWVGRLLEKIEDLGLLENTVIIFTTDHGFLHGEHGIIGKSLISEEGFSYVPLYEEINHIPLIIYMPGVSGGRISAIVQPMDIMPTILELAGIDIPPTVNGKSFASVLTGKSIKHRDYAVSSPFLGGVGIPVTVVKGNYAGILYPKDTEKEMIDKAVDGFEKRLKKEKFGELLFDLSEDPFQENPITNKSLEVVEELRKDLIKFLEEIDTSEDIIKRWRE